MKRILILSLVFALMFSLTACAGTGNGSDKDHTESGEAQTSSADPSEQETMPEAASGEESDNTVDASDLDTKSGNSETSDATSDSEENSDMKMMIGDTVVPVTWEQNESADALRSLVRENPLTIQMSMYGGFEQVGPIGQSLPRNDVQTTTGAGDIVLYSGNQIVVFYGSNSWAYTRLGHIDLTQQEMSDLLSNGDVTITLE